MAKQVNRLDVNFPNLDWIDHGLRMIRTEVDTGDFGGVRSRNFENWMNSLLYRCLDETTTFPSVPVYAYERAPKFRVGGGDFKDLGRKLDFEYTSVVNDRPDSSGLRPDFRFEGPGGITVIESKVNNNPSLHGVSKYRANKKVLLVTIGFSDEADLRAISSEDYDVLLWEDLLEWIDSADAGAKARRALAQVLTAIAPSLQKHEQSQRSRMTDYTANGLDFTKLSTYYRCIPWARSVGIITQ